MIEVVPDVDVLNDGRHYCLGTGRDAISVESQRNDGDGCEQDALMAAVKTIEGGGAENDAGTVGRRDVQKHDGDSWFTGARFSDTHLADKWE